MTRVNFTSKIEEFVAHNGPKLSYTKVPLGKEFFVKSNGLLFEQGINNPEIIVSKWDETACFFYTGKNSSIPFDIFAASFYLITRYEEYLPHVRDAHERFTVEQSTAYKYHFIEKPVIDLWALKLRASLKVRFPKYHFTERDFKYISTIDVDNAYAYKHKNSLRVLGAFVNDFLKLDFRNSWDRLLVLLRIKSDPFDTFKKILSLCKENPFEVVIFFLLGTQNFVLFR